jgi:Rieske Fe-S protein
MPDAPVNLDRTDAVCSGVADVTRRESQMNGEPGHTAPGSTSRRVLFTGAGAVGAGALLAACGGGGPDPNGQDGQPGSDGGAPDGGAPDGGQPGGQPDENGGDALASVADVEVGGGIVNAAAGVVVTQPTEGEFLGFSAICTHQGCTVGTVRNGTINCPCHGSRYSIEDGSVVQSAPELTPDTQSPLSPIDVEVDGDSIVRA